MRFALGILAGVLVVFACVAGIQMIGHAIDRPPEGLDPSDRAAFSSYVGTLPLRAFLFVAASWFVGALLGAWAAGAIALRPLAGWLIAIFVAGAAGYTMAMVPHPAWMWAAGILLPLLAGWLAQRLIKRV